MKKSRLFGALCVCIFTLCISLSANAALVSRLGGLAYYDNQLNITWAADANINGKDTWNNQVGWAAGLTVGGVGGWRLPIADRNDDGNVVNCSGGGVAGCADNEIGFLYWEEGITAVAPGPFSNVQSFGYWSATEVAGNPSFAWFFNYISGARDLLSKSSNLFAWAVRSGDVLGLMQLDPILPDPGPAPPGADFLFTDVGTDQWFDPPFTDTYTYEMTGGSLFTDILDFPTGFNNSFNVSAGGTDLGIFGPGQSVDFISLLGNGVSQFTLSGIDPLVDTEDGAAFPLKLSFDTSTASFTMSSVSAVPLPAAVWLFTSGLLGLIGIARKRKTT